MSNKCNCNLGPLEQEVLEIVWTKDCPSVRCVLTELNQKRSKKDKLAYTTIMTILKRLVKKGILIRKKESRSFRYEAKQSKQNFLKEVARQTIDDLKKQFGDLAVQTLKKELA